MPYSSLSVSAIPASAAHESEGPPGALPRRRQPEHGAVADRSENENQPIASLGVDLLRAGHGVPQNAEKHASRTAKAILPRSDQGH